ncbi:50S ribosome-binding GTPase [Candidatus Bathyarchaeota archaeon]|nr:50S ribosome-binding GTPase [Candidatus Bathyarchaeota archaeon]
MLAKLISRADVILEVLDVRVPLETRSIRIEDMAKRAGKPIIIVLNKADLAPRRVILEWIRFFENLGFKTVPFTAKHRRGVNCLKNAIRSISSRKPTIVLVAGLPKTGKSTVINALKGRASASTSPYPGTTGYTKAVQLYKVDEDIKIIDTPGVIPSGEDWLETLIRGTPIDDFSNPVKPAVELLKRIIDQNPKAIEKAYGLSERDPYTILEFIARKRGWFYKDGEPMIEEAAKVVIRNYHDAKLDFYRKPPQI